MARDVKGVRSPMLGPVEGRGWDEGNALVAADNLSCHSDVLQRRISLHLSCMAHCLIVAL